MASGTDETTPYKFEWDNAHHLISNTLHEVWLSFGIRLPLPYLYLRVIIGTLYWRTYSNDA